MGWPLNFFRKRKVRGVASEALKKIDTPDALHAPSSVLPKDVVETKSMGEVTGFYHSVAELAKDAIEAQKKNKESAGRVIDAIGAPPQVKKPDK